jgi:serine protease Do
VVTVSDMRAWVLTLLFVLQASSWPLLGETVSGSGFVIQSDGYVLTNHHVVADANQIDVVVPGKGHFIASVVADDDYKDLALLKIGVTNLEALPISESKEVNVLDTVVVLGYPLVTALGADVSASEGQVNAIRDEGRIPLLQIDANVNPGNSGGPALNDRKEVIGVVVSKLNAPFFLREMGTIPERVNFAIPIDEARGIVRKAYPKEFTPSAKTERLTNQKIFDQARKSTVFVVAERGETPPVSNQPSESQPLPPVPENKSIDGNSAEPPIVSINPPQDSVEIPSQSTQMLKTFPRSRVLVDKRFRSNDQKAEYAVIAVNVKGVQPAVAVSKAIPFPSPGSGERVVKDEAYAEDMDAVRIEGRGYTRYLIRTFSAGAATSILWEFKESDFGGSAHHETYRQFKDSVSQSLARFLQ